MRYIIGSMCVLAAAGTASESFGQIVLPPPSTESAVQPETPPRLPFGLDGVPLEPPPAESSPVQCTIERTFAPRSASNLGQWPPSTPFSYVVPYAFHPNVSDVNQDRVRAALAIVQSVCAVVFVPRGGQDDFIAFYDTTPGNGCAGTASDPCSVNSSPVGHQGGEQTIRIANWDYQYIIVHEVLHSLGYYHEQQRADRDQYILVQTANIIASAIDNFDVTPARFFGPYDFDSVMHYSRCAFSVCSQCTAATVECQTIRARPGFESFEPLIGQRTRLSRLDTHGLRSLYPRPEWSFVDPANSWTGTGQGWNPWRAVSTALTSAQPEGIVFVMPGTYSAVGTWSRPMTLVAPVGGVTLRE